MAGYSESSDGDFAQSSGSRDLWVRKLNRQGQEQWTYHFGGDGYDIPTELMVLQNGDIGLTGYTTSESLPQHRSLYDGLLLRLNPNGGVVYTRFVNGGGLAEMQQSQPMEKLNGIDTVGTGHVVVVGQSNNFYHFWPGRTDLHDTISCSGDAWINKYTSTYSNVWTQRTWRHDTILTSSYLAGMVPDGLLDLTNSFMDVVHLDAGGYVAVGWAGHAILNQYQDFFVARFDEDGDTLWTKIYGGLNQDDGMKVIETKDGHVVLVGRITAGGLNVGNGYMGNGDTWMMKLDAATGAQIWKTVTGNEYQQHPQDLFVLNDTSYMLVGYEDVDAAGNATGYDGFFAIYDHRTGDQISNYYNFLGDPNNDNRIWAGAYDVEARDFVFAVSSAGTGTTFPTNSGGEDWWVVRVRASDSRYEQVVGRASALPVAYLRAWPSPAATYLNVQATLPLQHASLYTLAGQQVAQWAQPGTRLQLPALPTGLYVLQATDGHTHYRQRIMVQQ